MFNIITFSSLSGFMQFFGSPGASASENHLTLASQLPDVIAKHFSISSPNEVNFSDFVNLFNLSIINLLVVIIFLIVFSLILFISYSKPKILLSKKHKLKLENNYYNMEVLEILNKTRKIVTLCIIVLNFVTIWILIALWHAFKLTVKYFEL